MKIFPIKFFRIISVFSVITELLGSYYLKGFLGGVLQVKGKD